MKLRALLLHAIVPLVIGVLLYAGWRASEVRLVGWLPKAVVGALRAVASSVPLPTIVIGSGPDLAWGWAFGATLALVWRGRPLRKKAAWLAAGCAVAAYAEIGQLWGVPPGVFDAIDLAAIVVGYLAGAFVASQTERYGSGQVSAIQTETFLGSDPKRSYPNG